MNDTTDATDIWAAIKAQPLAMMATTHDNEIVSRPMAAHADAEEGLIYFVTRLDTQKTEDIGHAAPTNLAFANPGKSTFVSIAGQATVSQDREKLRALWDMWAEAWLPDGPDAPDTALITVEPGEATIWDSNSSTVIRTIKTAVAAVTQSPPDIGTVKTTQL